MNNFLSNQLPTGILLLFVILAVTLMLTYLFVRTEKILLFNSLALLLLAVYVSTLLIPESILNTGYRISLQNGLLPLFFIILMLTVQSMYRVYLSDWNRIVIPLLVLVSVITFFCNFLVFEIHAARAITVISLFFYVPYFLFMYQKLKEIKPDMGRPVFIVTIMSLALMILFFELIAGFAGLTISDFILTYVSLVFIPLFAIIFAKEFLKNHIELIHIYAKLSQLENTGKSLSITETSEEKLKRVIDFIHENFASDISRDGLASAVGMNVNYMGSLFKSYTGKKIKEYINELRIKEAAHLLKSSDYKIIDIAFTVGFESLVTFNRIFKTITSQTPTQFRNTEK